MSTLEELKRQRKELDEKIKEMEKGNIVRCGNTRFEHRRYATGKEEFIIAVCRQREIRNQKYTEWWGQVLNQKSKECLMVELQNTIENMRALLGMMEWHEE